MDERINDGILRRILGEDSDNSPLCGARPSCSDGDDRYNWGLVGYPLAMVYSPVQNFSEIYDLDKALEAGTVFAELDLPFKGMSVTKGGRCRG